MLLDIRHEISPVWMNKLTFEFIKTFPISLWNCIKIVDIGKVPFDIKQFSRAGVKNQERVYGNSNWFRSII